MVYATLSYQSYVGTNQEFDHFPMIQQEQLQLQQIEVVVD